MRHERTLTEAGKKEVGHIFGSGYVPLVYWTPMYAKLRGELSRVFLVDWEALSEVQQDLVIAYMVDKFDDGISDQIRCAISQRGHFPIQSKYLIESYDMRYFY